MRPYQSFFVNAVALSPRYAQWLFTSRQRDDYACFGAVHLTSNNARGVDIASMARKCEKATP